MTSEEKAKQIIEKIIYITLATCSKDRLPWNSPVSAYHDDNYNFYWASPKNAVHSKNIRENRNVFIVIYDSTAPEGTGEGVYIKAKAYELNEKEEAEKALAIRNQLKYKNPRNPEHYLEKMPRRIYKAVPEKFWINGAGEAKGNYVDIRIEIKL